MNGPAVALTDCVVRRDGREILHVDRLDVAPGEVVGIVGPNGAGKSTLLSVCSGVLRPDGGGAAILGRDTRRLGAWGRTELSRRIGVVPQQALFQADLPLTVREVVSLGRVGRRGLLRPAGLRDRWIVDEWLGRLGLSAFARRTFRSLSGGERQKALIARAMAQEPELLLLDEPGAGLDLDWKERTVALVESVLAERPVTTLMVSHDTHLLPRSTHRAIVLSGGRIRAAGPPGESLTARTLSSAYGTPVETVVRDGRVHALPGGGGGG